MRQEFPHLLKQGKIGKLELKNRIVKAPTVSVLASPDGSVNEKLIRFYQNCALGGAGLVIVGFAYIDKKSSQTLPCQIAVSGDEFIAGLSSLSDAIKASGARSSLQIVHSGNQRYQQYFKGYGSGYSVKAPSCVARVKLLALGAPTPEELTVDEIREIRDCFGESAYRAQIAGFDMVEVHGCGGYLITNFLSSITNHRSDLYGGSLENRMRFLTEVVEVIRSKVGSDYPLCIRLNGSEYEAGGITMEETIEVAGVLENMGVDGIHVHGGNIDMIHKAIAPMGMPKASHIWAAEAIKSAVKIPVISCGSLTTPELAEEILEAGKADFTAFARPLFADPDWPKKIKEGKRQDVRPCIRCNDGCYSRYARIKPVMCSVNAALGREGEFPITPAKTTKKIVIIGGGPAGMEAARVSALRGHDVTLYENRCLGGTLIEASVPDFKSEIIPLIEYFRHQMKELNVKVIKERATLDMVNNGKFDAAIVATGGAPLLLDIPGSEKPDIVNALGVLKGNVTLGKKILIVGSGEAGLEVGLFLLERGKEVIFVEMLDRFMPEVLPMNQTFYEERFTRHKVTVHTGKRLVGIYEFAVVVDKLGNQHNIAADSVVTTGLVADNALYKQILSQANLEVFAIGDCVRPRRILDAIHEGYFTARLI